MPRAERAVRWWVLTVTGDAVYMLLVAETRERTIRINAGHYIGDYWMHPFDVPAVLDSVVIVPSRLR